jgi:hypothetical protein
LIIEFLPLLVRGTLPRPTYRLVGIGLPLSFSQKKFILCPNPETILTLFPTSHPPLHFMERGNEEGEIEIKKETAVTAMEGVGVILP